MLTKLVKEAILRNISGMQGANTLPQGMYMGLSTTEPTAAGENFTEPQGGGYGRIKIQVTTSGEPVFPFEWTEDATASHDEVWNKYEVHFNVATANWGTIRYVGIFDNSSPTPRLLAYGPLVDDAGEPTSITVESGHIPTIKAHQAKISIDLAEE